MNYLKIFNSLTNRQERFESRTGKVGMYVCGITPYDVTHLGHAFTYTFFDVFGRYLRHLGCKVMYVQNLTDIDDDMIKKARETGKNWRKLGEENAQQFLSDMLWLHNEHPDIYSKATDHIQNMQQIIGKLLLKGIAYERNGSVYFRVAEDRTYGALSKLSKKRMLFLANERGNDPHDLNKEDPLDFVLWQARKRGEPSWDSPWGKGRPGWHIECSAMSAAYLGETVDIHGGGFDLIFPHHESEIAQSEAATGKRFVRYWMHTAMLRYKGEKMSKSLGNLVLIEDLKKRYSSNVVRMYLLSHHYRSAFEFRERDIKNITKAEKLFQRVWKVQSSIGEQCAFSSEEKAWNQAMNDDLNTPKALEIMQRLGRRILKERKKRNIAQAKAFLNRTFSILGLVVEYK